VGGPAPHTRAGWPTGDHGGRQGATRFRARRRRQLAAARCLRSRSWRGAGPGGRGRPDQRDPPVHHLLDRIQSTGAVITADALHAPREHATYPHQRGAHYLLIINRTQPGLYAQLAALPWRDVPKAHDKQEHGHGRTERRTRKITAVTRGLAFPHATQAIRIVRRRKLKGKRSRETRSAVTSPTVTQAQLRTARDHHPRPLGAIEDRLHRVRDIDFDEDRAQIRTANRPRATASPRNLAITILRLTGAASITAAALRYHARQPGRPLRTITRC